MPAVAAAPLVAPVHVGYAHGVPQNIPPHGAQVNVFTKSLSPYIAAPFGAPVAAPFAAPLAAPLAANFAAPVAPYARYAPYAAAPYYGGPGPVISATGPAFAAPYSAPYAAAPYPYGAAAAPYGFAPAYVR